MVKLVTVVRPGHPDQTIPAVEVDSVEWVYTGEPTQEKMEEFAAGVRVQQWRERLADEAAKHAAGCNTLTERQVEGLHSWIWDFLDYLEPFSVEDRTIRGLAAWVGDNPPLLDFLAAQMRERQVTAYDDGKPVVDGPTHRAVLEVLAGLEAMVR